MKTLISSQAAAQIVTTNNKEAARILARQATGSIDIGLCAVFSIPLRSTTERLYVDSLEWGAGVASSAKEWIDESWSDSVEDFAIPDGF